MVTAPAPPVNPPTFTLPTDTATLHALLESEPIAWPRVLFPGMYSAPFAPHHVRAWDWAFSLNNLTRPKPFIAMWNRGSGKTSTAQGIMLSIGARRLRKYVWVVSRTQDQADEKVGEMGEMLEESIIGDVYPGMGDRMVGKYGHSKGWRRNRIRTSSGFTVDALGLDTAARGKKVESERPGAVLLDDLDDVEDSLDARNKLISRVTRKILPAGTRNLIVLGAQNLVHPDGFFGRMLPGAETPADYLTDRILSGPIPALIAPNYQEVDGAWTVTDGTPTWRGMDLSACQDFIATYGYTAFRTEAQHEILALYGGVYDHIRFRRISRAEFDRRIALGKTSEDGIIIDRVAIWVDPAVSNKDTSDCQAIQCDALSRTGDIYRLYSYEQRNSPTAVLCQALRVAAEYGALYVGVETDQGGETWESVFREAQAITNLRHITLRTEKAGSIGSKLERSGKALSAYEKGKMIHVEGTHHILEAALYRFPKYPPLDLADASHWCARDLVASSPAIISEPLGRIPRTRASSSGLRVYN